MKDIYFEESYGKIYENIENGESVKFEFECQYGSISNLFIKREIPINLEDGKTYYDITTPYGYGGPVINDCIEGKKEKLVQCYYKNFKKYCLENNIISEFIRFHPVLDNANDFSSIYNVRYMRNTVGTNLKEFNDPFQDEFTKSARKNVRRAMRDGVTYEIIEEPESIDEFLEIYYSTMDRNNADEYYYFDQEYFSKTLKNFKENILLVKSIYGEKTIAMGFYFKYKNYIHTHLSGTLTEYLEFSPAYVLRYALTEWGKKNGYNLIHHGGGTSNDENDSLYKFKQRFGKNTEFKFYIGTKVWNSVIYEEMCKQVSVDRDLDFFPAYRYQL